MAERDIIFVTGCVHRGRSSLCSSDCEFFVNFFFFAGKLPEFPGL